MSVILVVDSEGTVAKSASEAFPGEDRFAVIQRRTAGSAIALLLEGIRIDVAIIADTLEDMKGLDLLGSIRRLAPELPVIMTSRHASVESYLKVIHGGAYEFVEMPVKPVVLRRIAMAAVEEPAHSLHYRRDSHLKEHPRPQSPAA